MGFNVISIDPQGKLPQGARTRSELTTCGKVEGVAYDFHGIAISLG